MLYRLNAKDIIVHTYFLCVCVYVCMCMHTCACMHACDSSSSTYHAWTLNLLALLFQVLQSFLSSSKFSPLSHQQGRLWGKILEEERKRCRFLLCIPLLEASCSVLYLWLPIIGHPHSPRVTVSGGGGEAGACTQFLCAHLHIGSEVSICFFHWVSHAYIMLFLSLGISCLHYVVSFTGYLMPTLCCFCDCFLLIFVFWGCSGWSYATNESSSVDQGTTLTSPGM